ncbi:hypothetical protein AAC387_Pa07g1773 [Persea americana]
MAQQLLCKTTRCSFFDDGGRSIQLRIFLSKCKEIQKSSILLWFRFLQASSINNKAQKSRSSCFFFRFGRDKVVVSDVEGRGCGFQRQPSFVYATESSPTSIMVVISFNKEWSNPNLLSFVTLATIKTKSPISALCGPPLSNQNHVTFSRTKNLCDVFLAPTRRSLKEGERKI